MNRTASSNHPRAHLAAASLAACLLLSAAAPAARASESTVILGTPAPATLRNTADASRNEWLAANSAFIAEAFFTATAATSQLATANRPQYVLASSETGFPLERTIPEYYLGDQLVPPDGVDWPATYAAYTNSPDAPCFIFDTADSRVFVAEGGTHSFTWVRADGEPLAMNYVVSPACSGRPRRIYWTDDPWNAPAIDLTGKFVKFFGDPEILDPVFGTVTNYAGGMPQVITNQIVSGLHLDTSTHFLNAHGQLQGQVVMVYYDTGNFERILHVQVVEVCRPVVNRMAGEIGHMFVSDSTGYPCGCGVIGCVHSISSGFYMARYAMDRIKEGEESRILDYAGTLSNIDMVAVGRALQMNDPLALEVVNRGAEYLGRMFHSLNQIFDINIFVYGGGITNLGHRFTDRMIASYRHHSLMDQKYPAKFIPGELGRAASLIGATLLVK